MTTAPFTENNDVRSLTANGDIAAAGAGDDFVRALAGDDHVLGEEGADVLLGAAGADTLDGGAGDDVITGGSGGDILIGGDDLDTATYDLVSLSASDFAVVSGSWTVDAGATEGTDTLSGIEIVTDQLGTRYLLVGSGGFATIQAAVDAAVDGDTILLTGGTLAGDVTVTGKSLTFTGQGVGATTIAGQVNLAGDMAGKTLTIQDLTIDAAGKQYGLQFRNTNGSVVVDDAAIANASVNGIFYAHPDNGSQPTVKTGLLQSVSISDTTFEDNGHYNGTVGGPGGRGHVNLFGFNGTLSVTDSDFISEGPAFVGPTQPSGAIYKAVSVVGAGRPVGVTAQALLGTDADPGVQGQIGPLAGATLTGNNFEGSYTQDLVSFYYFTSIALTASGNTTTDVEAPWGLLNFDSVGGTVDVSGFFSGAANGQGFGAALQGLATDGSLTGTGLSDLIDGRAGIDNMDAGAGDDLIRISQGSAHGAEETINGGEGDDVILFNPAAGDTLVLSAFVTDVEAAAVVGAHPTYLASGSVAGNIDASAVTGLRGLAGNEGANALTGGADAQTILGNGGDDILAGGGGDDMLDGGAGNDSLAGGTGDDLYLAVTRDDVVVEDEDAGTDTVRSAFSHKLAANVENLELQDGTVTRVDFEDYETGALADGEKGWKVGGNARDQEIVDLGGDRGKVFKISSDPSSGDYAGPYSVPLTAATGETGTTALYSSQEISFAIRPVNGADNSRLEIDFANVAGTDRNNFMVIESVAGAGLRIAAARPDAVNGSFGSSASFPNDWTTLAAGLDAEAWHTVTLKLTYVDGANNDVIEVLVDGTSIGFTTTFENYRDFATNIGQGAATREANQTNRLLFRTSNNGQPADGEGGLNQGFYLDDLSGNNNGISGTGNALANVITGNSGDNLLSGMAGDDTLNGGVGADTLSGGEGNDSMSGGEGGDIYVVDAGDAVVETCDAAGIDVVRSDITYVTPENIERLELTGGADIDGTGNAQDNVVIGNSGANLLSGEAGADRLDGAGGNDGLDGGAGDDVLVGGSGVDTATYAATLAQCDISSADGVWLVDGGDAGIDSVSGVEVLDDASDDLILLVGNGGFATIQAALDYADGLSLSGIDLKVMVAGGTAAGAFTVASTLDADTVSITAVGSVVIDGTFHEANGNFSGTTGEYLRDAVGYTGVGAGVTINRGDVTLDGLEIRDFTYGVTFGAGTLQGVTLNDLTLAENVSAIRVGTTGVDLQGLTIQGGVIKDGYHGVIMERGTTGGSAATNLVIDGTTFERMTEKGIYLEGLEGGSFTNLTMTNVGQWGRGTSFGGTGANAGGFGAGIDINLKYGDFTGAIEISDFTFTDVGNSDRNGAGDAHFGGAAITVKARNDAGSYNTIPASYTGIITVRDGTIDGTSTAIRLGEPGKSPTGSATPVTGVGTVLNVSGVTVTDFVTNALHGLLDNRTTAGVLDATFGDAADTVTTAGSSFGPISVTAGDGGDLVTGGSGSTVGTIALVGVDNLSGGAGDDTLEGGAGADVISGGAGDDLIRIGKAADFAAGETIDGGADDDTILFNPGADATLVLSADVIDVETVSVAAGSVAAGIDASALTGVAELLGNDGANALTGGADAQLIEGFGGNDALAGGGGADRLLGGDGIDELNGGDGADTLDGGAETADTAVFEGNFEDYTFSMSGGALLVTRPGETDTLLNVEKLVFADHTAWVVDGTGDASDLLTIQSAVDAASASQIILVAPGTYAENVTIDKNGLKLFSVEGAATTTIAGNPDGAQLGAVQFAAGLSGVQLGATGQGFRIEGLNGNGALEKAAIYLTGNQTGHVIQGNVVVAQGDAGLMSEFGGALITVTIDGNEFTGQTFIGDQPTQVATFGTQFDVGNNLARQLVVLSNGGGAGASSSNGVVFTNNLVNGEAGGGVGGNTMVTIDVSNATVSGNEFTGITGGFGVALRMRRDGATITNNTLDGTDGGESRGMLIQNQTSGTYTGNLFLGGSDADTITGMTPGADSLSGDGGDDVLAASAGADTIDGGTGADTLSGGDGADRLIGGDGSDTAVYTGATSFIRNFDGSISAYNAGGNDLLSGMEFAVVDGGAAIAIGDLPAAAVTMELVTDSGGAGDDLSNMASVQGTGRALTELTVTWVSGGTTRETTVLVGADGTWSATLPDTLPDGEVAVSVTQTDGIGGTDGDSLEFIYDTVTATPTIDLVSDSGANTADNLTNDTTPTFMGTAEAGALVEIYAVGGALVASTVADEDGDWSATLTTPLGNAGHVFEAVATDAAGNSATSAALPIVVDAVLPTMPTIDLAAASDSADDSDDVTSDATPTFTGSADTGSVVRLYAGTELVGTTVASAGNGWSITSSMLGDDAYSFTVESEDAAGNIATSAALAVTIDTTDPVTPVLDLVAESDTGTSSTDNLTSEIAPTFLVTGEAGTKVVLYSGATVVASGTIGEFNTVELPGIPLEDGPNSLTVVSIDTAGNASTSAVLEVVVDAMTATPTIDLDADSDSGTSATDNITNDTTPAFSGTAEAGASIAILRDDVVVHTTTVDGSGNWSWISDSLSDGSYAFSVKAEDQSGNLGTSDTLSVEIDATPPAAPVLTAAVLTTTAGDTFVLSGTAEADLVVTVLAGATVLGTTTADADGNWSFAYEGPPLVAGSYDLTATTVDAAGNDSAASAAYGLVVGVEGGKLTGGNGSDSLGGFAGNDTLDGGAGNDTLNGGAGTGDVASYAAGGGVTVNLASGTQTYNDGDGTDTLIDIEGVIGSAQGDYLYGSSAANMLAGGAGDDVMDGDAGGDTIIGGAGADEMAGGDGFDTASYAGASAAVSVSLASGLGSGGDAEGDQLFSFEALIGTDGADSLAGDSGANRLDGGTGNDTLLGAVGGDTLIGGLGFDVISYEGSSAVNVNLGSGVVTGGEAANDVLSGIEGVIGGNGSDLLTGSAEANLLDGRNGNDSLSGASGDDTLLGGIGNDTLIGGIGNDSLSGGDGNDTLSGGDGNDMQSGGVGADSLSGGDGNDTLYGDAGADSLFGGAGNDTYHVDGLDTVQEAVGGGRDVIIASASFTLAAGLEIEEFRGLGGGLQLVGNERGSEIYGGSGNDILNGAAGADVLVGNGGADTLIGGSDNDTFYVDGLDTVQEAVGGGTDVVFASASITLAAGQEIEVLRAVAGAVGLHLTGNELANTVLGDTQADTLSGGGGNDTLSGGGGNDTLYGNAGADSLVGGASDDSYYVDALDTVREAVGGGRDTVYTSVNFALGAGQEIEVLNAMAGATGLRLTGNELANLVVGDAGADTLSGGGGNDTLSGSGGNDTLYGDAGADSLSGGAGNDTYYVDGLDTVQEAVGGGRDVIFASASFTLAAGLEIEEFRGLGGGLQLVGNERGNEIYGGSGNDILNGAAGSDVLVGNGGSDTLIGGSGIDRLFGSAGQDTFVLSNLADDRDVIADFVGGTDVLQVSVATFGGDLVAGPLAADSFLADATGLAGDADDRFIYNTSNGVLYYDVDGSGAGGPVQVATLSGVPTLAASDFILVG